MLARQRAKSGVSSSFLNARNPARNPAKSGVSSSFLWKSGVSSSFLPENRQAEGGYRGGYWCQFFFRRKKN
jgi:hypothetical protein